MRKTKTHLFCWPVLGLDISPRSMAFESRGPRSVVFKSIFSKGQIGPVNCLGLLKDNGEENIYLSTIYLPRIVIFVVGQTEKRRLKCNTRSRLSKQAKKYFFFCSKFLTASRGLDNYVTVSITICPNT